MLRSWFIAFQAEHPEAHISCAGRGADEQTEKLREGRSRARYGKSAHNYNCAIDVFVQLPKKDIYDSTWFQKVLAPKIPYHLKWYGSKDSDFYELPHIEVRDWRKLASTGGATLVEPIPGEV